MLSVLNGQTVASGHICKRLPRQVAGNSDVPAVWGSAPAGLDEQADGGALVAVYYNVYKGGVTNQVNTGRREKTSRDGDRLDCLIEGTGANGLHFRPALFADGSGQGPCHLVRVGMRADPEHIHGLAPLSAIKREAGPRGRLPVVLFAAPHL